MTLASNIGPGGDPEPLPGVFRARALLAGQLADGCWSESCDAGPATSAKVIVALRFAGELDALGGRVLRRIAHNICAQQQEDGSFLPWPETAASTTPGPADEGVVVCATAAVLAGLHASGVRDSLTDVAMGRAHGYLSRSQPQAPFAAVTRRRQEGDDTELYLAMAGLLDARTLPSAPLAFRLIPGSENLLELRVSVIMPLLMLASDAIGQYLKSGQRPPEDLARLLLEDWKGLVAAVPAVVVGERLERLLGRFENADGSYFYGDAMTTSLAVAALHAVGTPKDDRRIRRAVKWLCSLVDGDHIPVFRSDVWTTAFRVRSLLAAGLTPWSEPIVRALSWLIDAQREGSWAFQAGNTAMPDLDDTAMAIASLAIARDAEAAATGATPMGDRGFGRTMHARIEGALDQGRAWLLARQNADGGWPSFQLGMPSKPPGPFMTAALRLPDDSLLEQSKLLVDPPPELGDPAVEDVTGRVLFALGKLRMRPSDAPVRNALDFLRRNQMASGAFWGRWVMTYVPSTAWVLRGLAAVQADLSEPWIARAIAFLGDTQLDSGGWGEDVGVVRDPARAGKGRPTRFHTGSAVSALIEAGGAAQRGRVDRGLAFLRGGTGGGSGAVLHPLVPPESFYTMPASDLDVAAEAIGLGSPRRAGGAGDLRSWPPAPGADPIATEELLVTMLDEADPEMARIVGAVPTPERITALLKALTAMDSTDVPDLPEDARRLFTELVTASSHAATVSDEQRAVARRLFERCGWIIASSLFCSSLPQCFAFAQGAAVLAGTGRLTNVPERRIIETMQFVFDVATGSANVARSSALKVRLIHELIRRESVREGTAVGTPINQQHLLLTMLSFSSVVVDGVRALGLEVSDEEEEAWLALWREAGAHLGIRRRHLDLVRTPAACDRLFERMRDLGWAASPEGTTLARALVEMLARFIPGKGADGLAVALIRHLAGNRCADLLGLPPADWTRLLIDVAEPLNRVAEAIFGRSRIGYMGQAASYELLESLASYLREGKNAPFRIPPDLLASWRRDHAQLRLRRG